MLENSVRNVLPIEVLLVRVRRQYRRGPGTKSVAARLELGSHERRTGIQAGQRTARA